MCTCAVLYYTHLCIIIIIFPVFTVNIAKYGFTYKVFTVIWRNSSQLEANWHRRYIHTNIWLWFKNPDNIRIYWPIYIVYFSDTWNLKRFPWHLLCTYLFTRLNSAWRCLLIFVVPVANREVVDCPLVGKQCNIKTHNTIKGCFYLFLLYFL